MTACLGADSSYQRGIYGVESPKGKVTVCGRKNSSIAKSDSMKTKKNECRVGKRNKDIFIRRILVGLFPTIYFERNDIDKPPQELPRSNIKAASLTLEYLAEMKEMLMGRNFARPGSLPSMAGESLRKVDSRLRDVMAVHAHHLSLPTAARVFERLDDPGSSGWTMTGPRPRTPACSSSSG